MTETTVEMNYVDVDPPVHTSPSSSHEYESVDFDKNNVELNTTQKGICTSEAVSAAGDEVLAGGGDGSEVREGPLDVPRIHKHESVERLYYTLPRKAGLLNRLRRKPLKTVAEVGVQVEESDASPQQQLQQFMTGVSAQILQLHELCAKQERLENLSQKISDLVELNKNISKNAASASSTDRLIVAYMEAKDQLDHMKSRLEESFQENELLVKRLDERGDELRSIVQERDDVRTELETSMSRTRDLELNSSTLLEQSDKLEQEKVAMNTMSENLEDALKKRDKYKKLFVKLKVNSSVIVDHYINELNMALYDNRQVLVNAIQGGPKDLREVGRQIDNFLHIQQENNRLTDQVEYLSAQLTVSDILVDEITEQMGYMTQLLNEYKEAGVEPTTVNGQHLQKQIDRYTALMKDKEQYFTERKAVLRKKLSRTGNTSEKSKSKDSLDLSKITDDLNETTISEAERSLVSVNNTSIQVEDGKDPETNPRTVTSHGDTPVNNETTGGEKSSKKKKKKSFKLRRSNKKEKFVPADNQVESTQSVPNVVNYNSNRNTAVIKDTDSKGQNERQYNFF